MKGFLIALLILGCSEFVFSSEPNIVIDLNKSFSLNSVKVSYNGFEFYPSFFGGISVINEKGALFHPWSSDIKYRLIKKFVNNKEISTEWIMYKENDFYYHYGVTFERRGKNLTIRMFDLGMISSDSLPRYYADVYAVYLDRCENAINPVVISVPYLTMFNILLANNCFVSMYFDWNKTNASQIVPYNNKSFSSTSEYYSQYAMYNPLTNGQRNKLDETIYLKVSDNIDDVLPELSNPVSKYKEESSKRIVFDDWDAIDYVLNNSESLNNAGINNLWYIVHNNYRNLSSPIVSFYNVIHPNNNVIKEISNYNINIGNLISVHENHIEMFTKSNEFNRNNLSFNSKGKFVFNWYDEESKDTSYLVKPSKIFDYVSSFSRMVHSAYNTNSSFYDVAASYDPSKYVDYDYGTAGAGKFSTPYNIFKSLADTLRRIHNGPVSSEGLAHFLYVGYYDDISSAQIHTAKSLPGSYGSETEGGFYKPLLVNFDLLRMKEKAMVHGVGYYERFFYKDSYWQYMGRSRDSALIYAATELAYGHGAFISKSSYNFIEQGLIEYRFVYPIQLRYFNSNVIEILYNDDGRFLTASDYIRRYSLSFDKFNSEDFMGQVYVEYDNGVRIFVNRQPYKNWKLDLVLGYGFYSFHAILDNNDSLFAGYTSVNNILLPRSNGWLCYSPN